MKSEQQSKIVVSDGAYSVPKISWYRCRNKFVLAVLFSLFADFVFDILHFWDLFFVFFCSVSFMVRPHRHISRTRRSHIDVISKHLIQCLERCSCCACWSVLVEKIPATFVLSLLSHSQSSYPSLYDHRGRICNKKARRLCKLGLTAV